MYIIKRVFFYFSHTQNPIPTIHTALFCYQNIRNIALEAQLFKPGFLKLHLHNIQIISNTFDISAFSNTCFLDNSKDSREFIISLYKLQYKFICNLTKNTSFIQKT